MNKNIPFIESQNIFLRPLEESDAQGPYARWLNDEEVCRGNSHHRFPFTREAALSYILETRQSKEDLVLAIILRSGERHIGNIALQNTHPITRSAEFAILLGEKDCWGKGYAKEAARLLFDHGFGTLNLNRIECGTFDDNVAMKRLALSLGMKEEGRRRQAAFKNNRYVDVIEYGVLRSEYAALALDEPRA
jgi:RimJ/RimL family protein N-acetyltransferase